MYDSLMLALLHRRATTLSCTGQQTLQLSLLNRQLDIVAALSAAASMSQFGPPPTPFLHEEDHDRPQCALVLSRIGSVQHVPRGLRNRTLLDRSPLFFSCTP